MLCHMAEHEPFEDHQEQTGHELARGFLPGEEFLVQTGLIVGMGCGVVLYSNLKNSRRAL